MSSQNNIVEKIPQQEISANSSSESASKENIKKLEQADEIQKEVQNISDDSIQTPQTQIDSKVELNKIEISKDLPHQIEDILESGLSNEYIKMSPEKQKEFKEKGEETSNKIAALLRETKVKINKIIHLIIDWLMIIPGINKFFIKQEAKIKTEKLLKLKK